MSEKVLMKGNEAIAESAIRAGCYAYFGYPITPQNEIIAWMAKRMPELGRVFVQGESEVASINMVYGAACTGVRSMTSSSSPGISLKQEGISYCAGADLPIVFVNMVRGGPGLGSIAPAQSDYFQSTRGGGHGDYYVVVLAPKNVQEAADLTYKAFDIADKYRMPVMILGDGLLGQMMESVELPEQRDLSTLPDKSNWAVGNMNKTHRLPHRISSIELEPTKLEKQIINRFEKYKEVAKTETRYEMIDCENADIILVAYGTSARICQEALQIAKSENLKVGIFRPITLWPFPSKALEELSKNNRPILCVEMSMGQMIEDVRLAVHDKVPVHLLSHSGGVIPTEDEIINKIHQILGF